MNKEHNAYNLLHDLMEKIDDYHATEGHAPYIVDVNAGLWTDASSIDGFPPILYISRVVCGQTVWPKSNVEYISVK